MKNYNFSEIETKPNASIDGQNTVDSHIVGLESFLSRKFDIDGAEPGTGMDQ